MLDEYGRRLSARQKLTRETLVFFGNFTRQNGVVEHQLDIGFQAVTAGQAQQRAPAGTVYFLYQ